EIDADARKSLFIDQLLDRAFTLTDQAQRRLIAQALGQQQRLSTRDLPVRNVRDLLAAANAVALGSEGGLSSEFRFRVTPLNGQVQNACFDYADEFEIELISLDPASSTPSLPDEA